MFTFLSYGSQPLVRDTKSQLGAALRDWQWDCAEFWSALRDWQWDCAEFWSALRDWQRDCAEFWSRWEIGNETVQNSGQRWEIGNETAQNSGQLWDMGMDKLMSSVYEISKSINYLSFNKGTLYNLNIQHFITVVGTCTTENSVIYTSTYVKNRLWKVRWQININSGKKVKKIVSNLSPLTEYWGHQHQNNGKPNILIINIHLDDYIVVESLNNTTFFVCFTFLLFSCSYLYF
jgi:hypothetical protein